MPIRLSGINSGLDTDAIVKELVNAYSLKTEKYEKAKTKLEWKQDAWKDLNTKIYGLYTNVSNLRYTSAYNMRRVSVSDATKAKVTASDTAVTGTQMLSISKTAQASYITGAQLGDDVTSKTKLSELGFVEDGETTIELRKGDGTTTNLTVTRDTTIDEFVTQLKDAGLNASFDANNKRFFISAKETGVENDFNLYGTDENSKKVLSGLGLTTALLKADGTFTEAGKAKYQSSIDLYMAAEKEGKSIEEYLRDQIADYEERNAQLEALKAEKKAAQETITEYEKLQKHLEAREAHNDTYVALTQAGLTLRDDGNGLNSYQLRDMVSALYGDGELTKEELEKYINDEANGIVLGDDQSVDDIYATLLGQKDNMQKVAAYTKSNSDLTSMQPEQIQEKIDAIGKENYEAALETIADKNIEIAAKEKEIANHPYKDIAEAGDEDAVNAAIAKKLDGVLEALNVLGNAENAQGGAVKITGTDAQIVLNGVTFTSASNTFSINGLTIEAQAVTTDGPIQLTTTIDTQGIYDKIKDFLTEYNSVINEMAKLYNADSAKDYEPLTDEEKDAMSDTEIEKWENKIKSALLRRDTSLDGIMSAMINSMSQSIEVDGEKLSLSTFGISTLGFLNAAENEQYAYHIDGDPDDANSSGKPDKLMAAIQDDPDQIANFMKQLATNLYNAVDAKMKSTTLSSAYKVYNDKEMDKQMENYEDMIKKWEDKVAEQEDFYYNKFSQMEVALSKLQSQTNSLAGMLGQ